MAGKVILLTGASSGIGKVAAVALSSGGAELSIVCHTQQKAESAKAEIVKESGNRDVTAYHGDLLLQKEVRRIAAEFSSRNTRLDVLVNNAGRDFPRYAETEDGLERTMALNYFTPFLLTNQLLPLLLKGAPSRVVNVSSIAHFSGKLDLDNINGKGDMGAGGLGAYSRSKLALNLFTYELARRMEGKGVTANCLHPGDVRTNIWRHTGAFTPLTVLFSLFLTSPEKGARTTIYLASSPDVEGVTGKYFDRLKERKSAKASYDTVLASRLWDMSLKLTGLG